jgi:hypothetical protein
MRITYTILVGKPGGRRLGRSRRRWENIIIMDIRGIVWGIVDWIHLAQVRDKWWALEISIKGGKFLD